MSDPVITVTNLSKKYTLRHQTGWHQGDGLRHVLQEAATAPWRWLRQGPRSNGSHGNVGTNSNPRSATSEEFWALKDVAFEVNQGEAVGIIGRNGAGKSTLLKLLSRITEPSRGRIHLKGRVASLLEVGTGFHPELTGRENIFLNGAILGMTRAEIKGKFDAIVAFSGIEKFLDTPVKRYSSGMYVRLAFSVAAHLEPEILIVDEVLAVGDTAFQKKCLGKMNHVVRNGRTVLFVSHNIAAVEHLCDRGLVLSNGQLVFGGPIKQATSYYLRSTDGGGVPRNSHVIDLAGASRKAPNSQSLLRRLELFTDDDKPLHGDLGLGAGLKVRIHFELPRPASNLDAVLAFDNLLGQRIFSAHTAFQPNRPHGTWAGARVFVCDIPALTLIPGEYKLKIGLDIDHALADSIEDAARLGVIASDYYGTGNVPTIGTFVLKHSWTLE